MIDRGLIGSVFNKMVEKDKTPRQLPELNELIRATCDESFDKKINQEFIRLHCNMKEWNSKQSVAILTDILTRFNGQTELVKKVLQNLEDMDYTDFNVEFTKKKLQKRIQVLEKLTQDYKASWLERSLTVNKVQVLAPIWIDMQTENIPAMAKRSFTEAFFLFSHPDYPKQLSLRDIIGVLETYGRDGVDSSAGEELCKKVCVEVCRRVTDDIVVEFDPEIDHVTEYFRRHSAESYVRLNSMVHINFEDKKSAFIKIYNALRDGESGKNKDNFLLGSERLDGKDFIQRVINHATLHPESREAKAWSLAKFHYKDCTTTNVAMMSSIYKWSFKHSGFWGFFRRSKITGFSLFKQRDVENLNLTLEQLSGGAENSRRGRIRSAIRA